MTSEINKLKHFHIEDYSGINFTDDLNDGEEFLYTTIRCKDDKEVTLLCKYVKNKHMEIVLIVYLISIFALIIVLLIMYLNVENNGKYL